MPSRFHPHSLRVRLTLWYSSALILVALALAGASRWALAVSLDHALDQSLRYRLIGLHDFIDESGRDLPAVAERLHQLNRLGELFQVFGPDGDMIAQSYGLSRHHVSTKPPPDPGPGILFRNAGPPQFPFRVATQRIYVNNRPLIIEVADPQRKFAGVLNEFYTVLYLALPIVLLLAAVGGLWLSSRALSPVGRIIDEARALSPDDLSARLYVPSSGDELQRLGETLNQLLARVEQSLLQMRRFTSDASHELRAPMTLIHTAAEFALRRERSPQELKDSLRKILREAKRCTELINALLWLARADAETAQPHLASTDLTALVKDVAQEIELLASGKGLALTTDVPAASILVAVEQASFRRMLVILLDNAIKYTAEGGSVKLHLAESGNEVAISVVDTGVGIAADQLPFIFERFWRADPVRTRDAGGAGLGLAIAREIAHAHHASLIAESSPGVGSRFTIRLPH